MSRKVIIAGGGTGGHLYPALNLADALERKSKGNVEVMLIGAQRGIESRVLPERGVKYRLLPVEPIYRRRFLFLSLPAAKNWRTLVSAAKSMSEVVEIFESFAPDLVVGTGGYASGPVVAYAVYRGIPTAIQEQNSYPGLTTRLLAPHVDQVHLGMSETLEELGSVPRSRIRIHGNPIRVNGDKLSDSEARKRLGLDQGRVVLVMGGSQGARSINNELIESLAALKPDDSGLSGLPDDVQFLWSTGPDHYADISARLAELGSPSAVRAVPYVDDMEAALSVATLAVSRAGALALAELAAFGVPSVLVPYPFAAGGHQLSNAKAREAQGAGVCVSELVFSPKGEFALWRAISDLLSNAARLEALHRAALALAAPDAADRIAADLLELMEAA